MYVRAGLSIVGYYMLQCQAALSLLMIRRERAHPRSHFKRIVVMERGKTIMTFLREDLSLE